ncbi:Cation-dependent mannose-6-phosphate receptor-like [Oopsacas minuta]|uniref:Cation-dependent mannose-6-phosphate receptor-like n=1 Tax=Oopsacas minuta TaxID=111878 RepID=A0AAV7JK26_9METZ|nr:Cation-dependent mannose-6-phosphate receptor-like [Oopsacas minuta]
MRGELITIIIVTSLLILIGCSGLGEYSCLKVSSCSCKLVGLGGEIGLIDLSPLQDRSLSASDSSGYVYRYFPCVPGDLGADRGTCDAQNHVAICQIQPNKSITEEPVFTSCANQSTAEFSVQSISPISLLLDFSKGEFDDGREEYRLTKLEVNCNYSIDSQLIALGEFPTLTYNFILTSKYACPREVEQLEFSIGLGVLLVLFSYSILYLFVGVYINAFWLKKRGFEIFPNYHFWVETPFLFRDGFVFCLSICYRPIGTRIGTKTELEDSFDYREYNRIE